MSVIEWNAACGGSRAPLDRRDLRRLMEAYPDEQ